MKRREALKKIGLGAGFLVMGPTAMNLLQSCSREARANWEPVFLSPQNAFALEEILEVILPRTDTPGAKDLGIAYFLDTYMDQVAAEQEQRDFTHGAEAFRSLFEQEFDKDILEGDQEEFEKLVGRMLQATPQEREEFASRSTETQDPMDENPEDEVDPAPGAYAYLQTVRSLGIWAWKNSEAIGEEVMWYDPIPAQYIPCGPVEEFGNGKAMSL